MALKWLGMTVIITMKMIFVCDGCWEEERVALLNIKESYKEYNSNVGLGLYSWGEGDQADCCKWERVNCNDTTGRVDWINLSYFNYNGNKRMGDRYFNASLLLPFKYLRSILVHSNGLVGCVENGGFERLSMLKNLESLDLSDNNLNNSILSYLSNLPTLKKIYLSRNKLKGTINIEELNGLGNLQYLDISDNDISKIVAGRDLQRLKYLSMRNVTFGSSNFELRLMETFASLTFLDLSFNNFMGPVFVGELKNKFNVEALALDGSSFDERFLQSLESLPSLTSLSLQRFKGAPSILQGLVNLKNWETLDLSYNMLNYNFLQNIEVMTSLRSLTLINCELNGTVSVTSPGLMDLKNLEYLDLSMTILDNSFLENIGAITSLRYLRLDGCRLGGTLRSPRGVCELKHLQQLYLSNNNLHGPLPQCFSNLTSLVTLWIRSNQLIGNISPLGSLTSLQIIDISNNNFQIPISLNPLLNLSNLGTLYANDNEFYDDVKMDYPDNLTPRFQLTDLYLSSTRECGGAFPKFLYYQHQLFNVDLSNIKFKGEFPNWLLENNMNLFSISLANNSLTGNLQLSSGSWSYLSSLDISDNLFRGPIPQHFGVHFPGMQELIMSGNSFTGSIPSSFGNMSSLRTLDLSKNELSGAPEDYHLPSFRSLLKLDLSYNKLSGKFPAWIANSSSLSFLILSHNNLEGNLPSELCELELISLIDLSSNNLSGHILPCLRARAVNNIAQAPVGSEPVDFTTKGVSYSFERSILQYISGIDLSNNNFTGPIPIKIGELSELKVLNLTHNNLIGNIPSEFSHLEEIESLDLSYNKLEGEIPQQLTKLHFLAVFSVAHNNLTGKIPDGEQFTTFPNSSYEGNDFLCGPPLTKSCNAIAASPTILDSPGSDEEDGSFLEMEDLYVSSGIGYGIVVLTSIAVLWINPNWRRAWFRFIEWCINGCYYFFADNLPCLYRFRFSKPCV